VDDDNVECMLLCECDVTGKEKQYDHE